MPRLPCVLAASSLLIVGIAASAAAQGTARGVVLNTTGAPIAGAVVSAAQPEVSARAFSATTNENGQWIMLGLTSGPWEFRVEADGFEGQGIDITVSVSTPQVTFVLEALNRLPPDALPADILLRIDAASALRREGDFEGAAAAFETLRDALPELTMIDMVLAGIYREQAAQEDDAAERQALLLRAEEAEARLDDAPPAPAP